MASLSNPYFAKNVSSEQNLLQGLITESIQVMGQTYYYLPREIQVEDLILGEAATSKFAHAIPIEMYHEAAQGWDANAEILSKFGLQIQNQLTFVLSKPRWDNEISNLPLIKDTMKVWSRPQEGDLIYDPISDSLLEIKFVKSTNSDFFQFGKVYQYQLTCEFFRFEEETIETGIGMIDDNILGLSNDVLTFQVMLETGDMLLQEDGYSLNQDDKSISLQHIDRVYDTTDEFVIGAEAVEFNEINPFGEF